MVVGSSNFMINGGLLLVGNVVLVMNFVGNWFCFVWYVFDYIEGEMFFLLFFFDLILENVYWIIW